MRNVQRAPSRPRAPKQPRQFNSNTTVIDGITFDSLTEGAYYVHLKKDQSIKLIEVQPEFQIIKPYKVSCKRCAGGGKLISPKTGNPINCSLCSGRGKREKAGAIYTADFQVTYFDGYVEIIDVKGGPVGRDFSLRKKLFEIKTGMELIVIRSKNKEWVRD
ncbi:DUF1064 domain-containing protein [Sporosarcina sp. resist]|uniref:DUF1064 domain-containing protein n=1 Tax=Sporosarcina sp. resist TaxID=2762563 RepID=UPI00164EABF1|nr:DUF1064 domain-containing protein [Sporosarcina sp. resist]QNK89410.1 DUF1064 domain-containing protein [Sporosarcina sp. resist]